MQIIIYFPAIDDEELQAYAVERPLALLPLAGNVVLGHILHQVLTRAAFTAAEVVVLTPCQAAEVAAWVAAEYPTVNATVVSPPGAKGLVSALWAYRESLATEDVLLLLGQYIAEAPYEELAATATDGACLVQEHAAKVPAERVPLAGEMRLLAGGCWFRRGTDLRAALQAVADEGTESVAALVQQLQTRDLQISIVPAYACVVTDSQPAFLEANARLLGLGYGSEDAIERSYAEDFTVLPPVFIHENAVVENAVLGPFVNVEAGATVRNSVVRNSIIATGCQVEDVVLDSSLLGKDVRVQGRALTVSAGAAARIDWGG